MPGVITSTTASRQAPPPPASVTRPPAREPSPPPAIPIPNVAELQNSLRQIAQGLQLSRASTMALMRLQLAVRSGDRQQAMEAMDRLDTLDGEMERLVTRLSSPGPSPANADPDWQTLAKHLEDQKLALAFEKLALASGIVGPDLISIESAWPPAADSWEAEPDPEDHPPAPDPDMPDLAALRPPPEDFEAEPRRSLSPRIFGLVLTLLVLAAIAAAVLLLN